MIFKESECGVLQREKVRNGSVSTAVGDSLDLWGKPQGPGREIQTGIQSHSLLKMCPKNCLCLLNGHLMWKTDR